MRLRIISGEFKGRFITTIQDDRTFRPTLERVRQSIAEIIKNDIEGAVCADVCAGSGAFGFELISRGAKFTEFIEKDSRRARKIDENAQMLDCKNRCIVYTKDARMFIKSPGRSYDIIYFDPPYDLPEFHTMLQKMITMLTDGGMLIYERRRENKSHLTPDVEKQMFDKRDFGGTVVEFYRNNKKNHAPAL